MIFRLLSPLKLFAVAVFAAVLILGLADVPRAEAADDRLQFTGTTLSGAGFNGASLQGKPAVLWFWTPWCPFCNAEAPGVSQVAAANPGVTFVGVAAHSDVGAMQNFVSKYNLNFTNLNDADGSIWARYNVPWQPAYVFYRADGTSTFVNNPTSAMSQQELAGRVAALAHQPMTQALIGLAFAAGLVAALNPCGFAMLPAYLLLVVRGQQSGEQSAAPRGLAPIGRALAATVGMALGFFTVFGLFGALTISAAATVQRYLPYVTVVIGVVLVGLGVWLLSGRELTALTPRPIGLQWAPNVRQRSRIVGMYGYGVSYAIASLSCTIGPFLAVTAAGFRGGSIVTGVSIYLAYVAGLTLVVGVLAVAAATASSALAERLRRVLPFVNRISGVLLVVVGLYVAYYGLYELRLFSSSKASPQDAVITAAGRLQGVLAGWVHQHGVWPWVVALFVLVVGALASAWRRRAQR